MINHDLNAQLNSLKRLKVYYKVFDAIRDRAYVFNSWETETRYKDSFIALSEDVELAIQICEELIQIIESGYITKSKDVVEIEFFH